MNLFFVPPCSRLYIDDEGKMYTGPGFSNDMFRGYRRYCDSLTILCSLAENYSKEEASRLNPLDLSILNVATVPDLYRPHKNFFNPRMRHEAAQVIESEVKKADRVVIRVAWNFYSAHAYKMCRKYNKQFSINLVGFELEGNWYHSFYGQLLAPYREYMTKRLMANVPYAIYVTNRELQKRYPTKGKYIGCSDVELHALDDSVLQKRLQNEGNKDKIIFGTAAFLHVKWKGQKYVIQALAELKSRGITNVEYHLAGLGDGSRLEETARKFGVEDQVKIQGAYSADKIFDWYDHLDVYIQPSFQEGLCRAMVEAMSRALPVVSSDVGGNPELTASDLMFKAGNVKQIADIMEKMIRDPERRKAEAQRSFTVAHDYEKEKLYARRDKFFREFMK